MELTEEYLNQLRDIASNATPGPWYHVDMVMGGNIVSTTPEGEGSILLEPIEEKDAAYIAAASPDVVLALIAKIERLEREKGEILTTAFMDALARLPKTLKDQASDQFCKIHDLEYKISCLNREASWLADKLAATCQGQDGCPMDQIGNINAYPCQKICSAVVPEDWREAARKAVEASNA